jgi:hypothetical protein
MIVRHVGRSAMTETVVILNTVVQHTTLQLYGVMPAIITSATCVLVLVLVLMTVAILIAELTSYW